MGHPFLYHRNVVGRPIYELHIHDGPGVYGMIYFTLATALGIFLVYSVWVSSLGRHIATRGFERAEMPAGLRKDKWEILRPLVVSMSVRWVS